MASPSGHAAQPLIRVHGWRAFIALAMALSCGLVALVGTVGLLLLEVPVGVGVAAGATWAVSGALTAWAVDSGRWLGGPLGHVQRAATIVLLVGAAALVIVGIVRGIGLLLELPAYGTPPSAAARPFGMAAAGALALALLGASTPLANDGAGSSRARLRRATAGAAVVSGVVALGALAAAAAPGGCGTFDFQRERWRSELRGGSGARLVRMGEAVKRCGVVTPGMTRAQVQAKLGPPQSHIISSYTWWLGDDGGILTQSIALDVAFDRRDRDGRVTNIALRTD